MSPTSKCYHCAGIGLTAQPEFNTYIPNSYQVPMTALLEAKDNQIKELEKEISRRNILLQEALLELRELKKQIVKRGE